MRSRHASSPRRRCGGARGEGLGLGDGGGAEGNGDGGSRGGAGGCGGAGGAGSAGGDGAEPMMLFAVSTEPWGGGLGGVTGGRGVVEALGSDVRVTQVGVGEVGRSNVDGDEPWYLASGR